MSEKPRYEWDDKADCIRDNEHGEFLLPEQPTVDTLNMLDGRVAYYRKQRNRYYTTLRERVVQVRELASRVEELGAALREIAEYDSDYQYAVDTARAMRTIARLALADPNEPAPKNKQ